MPEKQRYGEIVTYLASKHDLSTLIAFETTITHHLLQIYFVLGMFGMSFFALILAYRPISVLVCVLFMFGTLIMLFYAVKSYFDRITTAYRTIIPREEVKK